MKLPKDNLRIVKRQSKFSPKTSLAVLGFYVFLAARP